MHILFFHNIQNIFKGQVIEIHIVKHFIEFRQFRVLIKLLLMSPNVHQNYKKAILRLMLKWTSFFFIATFTYPST